MGLGVCGIEHRQLGGEERFTHFCAKMTSNRSKTPCARDASINNDSNAHYTTAVHIFALSALAPRLSASHMAPARARAHLIPIYECILYCINSSFIEILHLQRTLMRISYVFCIICNSFAYCIRMKWN